MRTRLQWERAWGTASIVLWTPHPSALAPWKKRGPGEMGEGHVEGGWMNVIELLGSSLPRPGWPLTHSDLPASASYCWDSMHVSPCPAKINNLALSLPASISKIFVNRLWDMYGAWNVNPCGRGVESYVWIPSLLHKSSAFNKHSFAEIGISERTKGPPNIRSFQAPHLQVCSFRFNSLVL